MEFETLIQLFEQTGVRIVTIMSGDVDLATANGRAMARTLAAWDAREAEVTAENVARAFRQRAERGLPHAGGHRAFGYHRDGITIHPVEGPALTAACHDFLNGASLRSIARKWNDDGITTTAGAKWTGGNLRKVLLRPRNAGLIGARPAKEGALPVIIGDAQWEKLVERDTWEGCVAKLGDPSRLTHRGTSRRLVLAGIARCGSCGARIRSGGNAYNGEPRYACAATAKGGSQCVLRRARLIDEYVRGVVAGVLARDGVKLIPQRVDVTAERTRLRALEATGKQLAVMLGAGEIDPVNYRTAMESNREKREALQSVIAASVGSSPLTGIADAEDAGAAFLAADTDRQRDIIDALAVVTIHPTGKGARGLDPETVIIAWRQS